MLFPISKLLTRCNGNQSWVSFYMEIRFKGDLSLVLLRLFLLSIVSFQNFMKHFPSWKQWQNSLFSTLLKTICMKLWPYRISNTNFFTMFTGDTFSNQNINMWIIWELLVFTSASITKHSNHGYIFRRAPSSHVFVP